MKFLSKLKTKKKTVIVVVVILILIVSIVSCSMKGATAAYTEQTVGKRDIVTYHTFTGNITPVADRNVIASTASKVEKVVVSEGDEVKEGDTIATLESTDIAEKIKEMEATIAASKVTTDFSEKAAKKAYDDYKDALDQGLNSSILAAQAALDTATSTLGSAQKAYNNAQKNLMSGKDSTVATAKQGVDSALNALTNAQKSYKNNEDDIGSAEGDVNGAERAYDSNEAAISDLKSQIAAAQLSGDTATVTALEKQLATLQANSTSLSSGVSTNEKTVDTLKNNRDTLQATIDTATTAYNNAVASYQLAVQTSLTATDTLYDAYLNAQTAYNNAVASYNASALTVDQTLATYKQTYEKDKALNDNTVSQLQLKSLYDQLDDCTIKAPMTGTVTTVKLKAGEMTVLGSTVATVTSFDTMKINIKINEYDLFGAEEGKDVTINIDALKKSYAGTIKKIAKVATVEKGVSYFESEVDFIADEYVRSGMSVEIKLKIKEAKDVVAVTNGAIQYGADNTAYVMVKNGKKTENRNVIVGITDGSYTGITSGLSEGDIVMVAPTVAITSEDGVVVD